MADALRPVRWWTEEEPSAISAEIVRLCDGLEQDFGGYHSSWVKLLSHYEPRSVSGLGSRAYLGERKLGRPNLRYPLARSLVSTVVADIAGRQRPKPMFMTSGADWKTQRRAKKLGKFVVGQMAQRQGKFLDAWELMTDAFETAAVYGIAFVHVFGDAEAGCVRMERIPPWEILWDPEDAQYSEPNNLFRVQWMDEDEVIETYVDAPLRDGDISEEEATVRLGAIATSQARDAASTNERRLARQIKIYHAWRLPMGQKPGRYSIAIGGCLLDDQEWTHQHFPVLAIRWSHELEGFGGIGIVEESYDMGVELNDTLRFAQNQVRLNGGRRIFYEAGSVEQSDLEANFEETAIAVKPGSMMPQETAVPALNPSIVPWSQFVLELGHRGPGVSQTQASGRKEAGVESGVALRTMVDIATKRFAVKARAYENSYILLAGLIIAAVQDLVEQGESVRSSFPGEEFWEDLEWADVDLREDTYTIQVDTVSALSDRASGRIATLEESLQSGMISAEAFKRIAPPGGTLDLENESGPVSKQERYLNSLIDRYLDAEEGDSEFRPESPDGFILDLPGAVGQWIGAYFDAKLSQAPEFNQTLIRDYIKALDRLVQKAAQAQMAATAPPMAPPGGGPGMPATPPQMAAA